MFITNCSRLFTTTSPWSVLLEAHLKSRKKIGLDSGQVLAFALSMFWLQLCLKTSQIPSITEEQRPANTILDNYSNWPKIPSLIIHIDIKGPEGKAQRQTHSTQGHTNSVSATFSKMIRMRLNLALVLEGCFLKNGLSHAKTISKANNDQNNIHPQSRTNTSRAEVSFNTHPHPQAKQEKIMLTRFWEGNWWSLLISVILYMQLF